MLTKDPKHRRRRYLAIRQVRIEDADHLDESWQPASEGNPMKPQQTLLTLKEVARQLRCSKAHISNVLNGRVRRVAPLTHIAVGRRKLVRREWLDRWMEENKV